MKVKQHSEEIASEVDLLEVLREVYRRRFVILALTLAAGVVAAAVSLTKPDIYESSAALIIREPQTAIDRDPEAPVPPDEAPVLSVETLQMLTESTETMWILFEKLWSEKKLEMWKPEPLDKTAAFRSFQGALSTEVRRQQTRRTGTSIELLPILILRARAQSPQDAEIIANEWSRIVEAKSSAIYTQGVTALDDFIGNMYKQSNDSLLRLENDLAKKTLEASAQVKQAKLETQLAKITELEGVILDLDIELAVNSVAITEGKRRILEQQHDGEWIGTVAEAAAAQGEAYPFSTDKLSERAQRVLALVAQKVAQKEALREYRLAQNFLGKQKKFTHYQTDIERILGEKAKAEDELPTAEETLAALLKELETIPETITLDKAITDDALWDAAVNNPDADMSALAPLKTEVMNPVHVSTRERVIETTSRIETLRSSVEQLAKSADNVAKITDELESEIDRLQQDLDRQENALKDTDAALALLREDYLAEIKRVEEFEATNMRKAEEKRTREERLAVVVQETERVEEDIAMHKLDLDMLGREVEKTKNFRAAIASKAEAAGLLQVTAENASRTGTSILWAAQADPSNLAIGGRKMVLASMLVAFLLSVVAAAAVKVLRPEA